MNNITHTVIGIFDSEFDSLAAFDDLLDNGFTRHYVHLSDRGNSDRSLIAHEDDGHEERVRKFFKILFKNDDQEAKKYAMVALDSGSVITVLARSMDEANHALQIMDHHGAINVDDRAVELKMADSKYSDILSRNVAGGMLVNEDLSGPGLGSKREPGIYHKSRIIEWSGDGSNRISEKQLDEIKFW